MTRNEFAPRMRDFGLYEALQRIALKCKTHTFIHNSCHFPCLAIITFCLQLICDCQEQGAFWLAFSIPLSKSKGKRCAQNIAQIYLYLYLYSLYLHVGDIEIHLASLAPFSEWKCTSPEECPHLPVLHVKTWSVPAVTQQITSGAIQLALRPTKETIMNCVWPVSLMLYMNNYTRMH